MRACCPNGTERGSATRSSTESRTGAGYSMGFRTVERAAAHRAALRRHRNRFGQHALDTTTSQIASFRQECRIYPAEHLITARPLPSRFERDGVPIAVPKDAVQPISLLLWTSPVNFNNSKTAFDLRSGNITYELQDCSLRLAARFTGSARPFLRRTGGTGRRIAGQS